MITHGQTLILPDGRITVSGCDTPDQALWVATFCARLRSAKMLRKVLTKDQRERLVSVARRKLFQPAT